jgi:hypothetical protein
LKNIWPEVVFIKGAHKAIADVISWLEYDPSVNQTGKSSSWQKLIRTQNAARDKTG